MGLYNTRYFLWFFKRDLEESISMIKGQGLNVIDNEQFNLWVRKGTKVKFFGFHILIGGILYFMIRGFI